MGRWAEAEGPSSSASPGVGRLQVCSVVPGLPASRHSLSSLLSSGGPDAGELAGSGASEAVAAVWLFHAWLPVSGVAVYISLCGSMAGMPGERVRGSGLVVWRWAAWAAS